MDINNRMQVMVKRCHALGMKHICEKTTLRICSILTMATKRDWGLSDLDALDMLGLVRDFKVVLRLSWKNNPADYVQFECFPADPMNLDSVS